MKTIRVAFGGFMVGTAAFGLCALVAVGGVACSSPEKEGGEGAQCTVFTDCAGGLFCVPSGSKMICSADAAALVEIEETGAAAQPEAAATPEADGSTAAGPDDANGTGSPPSEDATVGADATSGSSAPEAAPPADDAAAPPADDASDEP